MKIDRTKNATRNITSGIALKLYQLITPFIIRTIMIYLLGVEYVGLNSLFTSILQVLNLAELGVGSAMVYSMYKPQKMIVQRYAHCFVCIKSIIEQLDGSF